MPIDSTIILNIAAELFKYAREEYYRSSSNRAYYGSFYECCKIAKNYGCHPKQKRKYNNFGHKEVSDLLIQFKSNNINTNDQQKIIMLGYLLKQAKDLRAKADYNDHSPYRLSQSEECLRLASQIMAIAKTI